MEERLKEVVSVRTTKEERRRWEKEANKRKRSLSNLVRAVMEEALANDFGYKNKRVAK